MHQVEQDMVAAEFHLDAVGVLLGKNAFLVAFGGPADGQSGGHGVQAEQVAEVIRRDDRVEARVLQIGPEGVDRFVLGPEGARPGVLAFFHRRPVVAGTGAVGCAARVVDDPVVPDVVAREGLHVLELARVPLPRGQDARGVQDQQARAGAVLAPHAGEIRGGGKLLVDEALRLLHGRGIGDRHLARSVDGDRLQVFRSHHGAGAAAPEGIALPAFRYDAGIADQVLARRADERDGRLVRHLLLDDEVRVAGGHSPELGRVPEFDLAVEDREVRRLRGAAGDDERVVAALRQVVADLPAGDRIQAGVRERGLGDQDRLRGEEGPSGVQRPGNEHDHVVGPERIDVGIDEIVEQAPAEPAPAKVIVEIFPRDVLLPAGLRGQVYNERACVHFMTPWHGVPGP